MLAYLRWHWFHQGALPHLPRASVEDLTSWCQAVVEGAAATPPVVPAPPSSVHLSTGLDEPTASRILDLLGSYAVDDPGLRSDTEEEDDSTSVRAARIASRNAAARAAAGVAAVDGAASSASTGPATSSSSALSANPYGASLVRPGVTWGDAVAAEHREAAATAASPSGVLATPAQTTKPSVDPGKTESPSKKPRNQAPEGSPGQPGAGSPQSASPQSGSAAPQPATPTAALPANSPNPSQTTWPTRHAGSLLAAAQQIERALAEAMRAQAAPDIIAALSAANVQAQVAWRAAACASTGLMPPPYTNPVLTDPPSIFGNQQPPQQAHNQGGPPSTLDRQ